MSQRKICPRCQAPAPLEAVTCPRAGCGHQFRTQFGPPPDRTQLAGDWGSPTVSAPPTPHYPPPSYPDPAGYPPPAYHPPVAPHVPGDFIQLPPGQHSPLVAALLAVLICPPMGQFYNRQTIKGIVVWVVSWLVNLVAYFVVIATWGAGLFTLVVPVAIWFFTVADAVAIASRLHRGEPVRPWQFF